MQALRALADNSQLHKKHSKEIFYLIFSKAHIYQAIPVMHNSPLALTTNENLSKASNTLIQIDK